MFALVFFLHEFGVNLVHVGVEIIFRGNEDLLQKVLNNLFAEFDPLGSFLLVAADFAAESLDFFFQEI